MHLTVRMAWHDNGWDGRVCQDPRANTYCSGTHSLLAGRIEKKKDVDLEEIKRGKTIAGEFNPDSVPPCYWSLNAFGPTGFKVNHEHAFGKQSIPTIPDEVKPYSIFTWPFKLSFVHNEANQKNTAAILQIWITALAPSFLHSHLGRASCSSTPITTIRYQRMR